MLNKIQVLSFRLVTVLALSLLVLSYPAGAKETNWYIGAGVGATEIESDIVLYTILNPQSLELKERDAGFKVFGGYKINDFFFFELSYVDFGKLEILASSSAVIAAEGVLWEFAQDNSRFEVDYSTIALGGIFSLPLKKITKKKFFNRLAPYGKFGVHYWSVNKCLSAGSINYYETLNTDTGNLSNPTAYNILNESGFGWFYGTGISCMINEKLSFALGWEWYRVGGDMVVDSDFIFLSVVYNF